MIAASYSHCTSRTVGGGAISGGLGEPQPAGATARSPAIENMTPLLRGQTLISTKADYARRGAEQGIADAKRMLALNPLATKARLCLLEVQKKSVIKTMERFRARGATWPECDRYHDTYMNFYNAQFDAPDAKLELPSSVQ